jgi:hypothetical protein
MADFTLKALTGADVRKDRSGITLKLDTDQGPVSLTMTAAQLDHLVTSLEGVEQQLTVLDPPGGLAPGEAAQMRFYIVEGTNIGNAMVNNVPCVAVIIKAGNSTRTYAFAFDREKAQSLARMVGDELPSLDRLTGDKGN